MSIRLGLGHTCSPRGPPLPTGPARALTEKEAREGGNSQKIADRHLLDSPDAAVGIATGRLREEFGASSIASATACGAAVQQRSAPRQPRQGFGENGHSREPPTDTPRSRRRTLVWGKQVQKFKNCRCDLKIRSKILKIAGATYPGEQKSKSGEAN